MQSISYKLAPLNEIICQFESLPMFSGKKRFYCCSVMKFVWSSLFWWLKLRRIDNLWCKYEEARRSFIVTLYNVNIAATVWGEVWNGANFLCIQRFAPFVMWTINHFEQCSQPNITSHYAFVKYSERLQTCLSV